MSLRAMVEYREAEYRNQVKQSQVTLKHEIATSPSGTERVPAHGARNDILLNKNASSTLRTKALLRGTTSIHPFRVLSVAGYHQPAL